MYGMNNRGSNFKAHYTAAASIWFEVWEGRQSGRRYFRFQPKKFPIFRKSLRFPGQKFLRPFLVVNSRNCLFCL